MSPHFVDRIVLQNRLFAELSRMFGIEVPLYDRALLVNRATNEAVCELLSKLHLGFHITVQQLERTSGERHGAIRIGRPDEYRWVSRYFGAFGMEPHNFYCMTALGPKSQPIIATAFRSVTRPELCSSYGGADHLHLVGNEARYGRGAGHPYSGSLLCGCWNSRRACAR